MYSGEAVNTNFIVFGLTRSGPEPMAYHTLQPLHHRCSFPIVKYQYDTTKAQDLTQWVWNQQVCKTN